jgi:DNA-binding NarL/FixJ family response regulator
MAWTVLIVDDHPGFRSFARRLLEADGFTVVGEAGDGGSAIEAAARLRPALVLLDVMLPDTDGFAVARRLAESGAESAVVLTSSREPEDFGDRLAQSPARGFIHKDELSGAALAAVANGGR